MSKAYVITKLYLPVLRSVYKPIKTNMGITICMGCVVVPKNKESRNACGIDVIECHWQFTTLLMNGARFRVIHISITTNKGIAKHAALDRFWNLLLIWCPVLLMILVARIKPRAKTQLGCTSARDTIPSKRIMNSPVISLVLLFSAFVIRWKRSAISPGSSVNPNKLG